jgi:hypothetical protein
MGITSADRAMKKISDGFSNVGKFLLMTILCPLIVTGCHFHWSYGVDNWQDNPRACARFWDNNIERAVNGNTLAASRLFYAIQSANLTPPGREVETYPGSEQKDFDTLALKRLSIRKHHEIDAWLSPYSDSISRASFAYTEEDDPRGVHREVDELLPNYLSRDRATDPSHDLPRNSAGICSQRTGLKNDTKEWAIACRQILADDGVLPSTEAFLATIPEDKRACNYNNSKGSAIQ